MADVPTTNLTVAKLKALCVLNDLSASGKKADLLARLLEAGVDKETLGVEVFDEATATFHAAPVDGEEPALEEEASGEDDDGPGEEKGEESEEDVVDDEPIMLSLEDEETITPSAEAVDVESKPTKKRQPARSSTKAEPVADDDEVLEAEILEADLLDDEVEEVEEVVAEPPSSRSKPEKSTAGSPMTLKEMVQRPQSVAVLLALLSLGAGGWYYVNNQLEPFTADSLRYGDSMGYIISGTGDGYDETTSGAMIATAERRCQTQGCRGRRPADASEARVDRWPRLGLCDLQHRATTTTPRTLCLRPAPSPTSSRARSSTRAAIRPSRPT